MIDEQRSSHDAATADESPRAILMGVEHDLDDETIRKGILEATAKEQTVMVEGSLYLGGFIPADAPKEKIRVMLEPPTLFTESLHITSPIELYSGGREIPKSGRGLRRMFETMAVEIHDGTDRRSALRMTNELLHLRAKYPDVIVYNEPQEWLRTVWYEADLLFHYLLLRDKYRLFGAFIFSEMDTAFAAYLEKNEAAISAMTADDVLFFAFGGRGDLGMASQYMAYRAVMEVSDRLEGAPTPVELDELREREARMLSDVSGINQSLLFGRKLGVRVEQTPCLVFWESLDEDRIVVVPLGEDADDERRSLTLKAIVTIITDVVRATDTCLLQTLEERVGELARQTAAATIGDIIRQFLDESTHPPR